MSAAKLAGIREELTALGGEVPAVGVRRWPGVDTASVVSPDWVDEMKAKGVANFPGSALSRQCFFCGTDTADERERALVAYVAAGSYDSADTFAVATDAWICHDLCVAAANPDFDRGVLAEPMRSNEARRSATCFFCGIRSDDPLDDTWAIFSLTDAQPSPIAAWLSHPSCLEAAHHASAARWRVWDEDPRRSAP